MCYHWPLLKTFPGSQIYLINSSDLFKYFKLRLGNSFYNETDLWEHIYDNVEYHVLDIVQCRVLYDKYFTSFSYVGTYFTSLWASEIIAKLQKRVK